MTFEGGGYRLYVAAWSLACASAVVVALRVRAELPGRDYLRFLARPWKLALFAVALTGFVIVAPWSGDPTWDRVDATFMSVLAFGTAPWSIGVLVRALRRQASKALAWVALATWWFSASWSYDLYILLRDGFYPGAWWSNAIASSVLYVAAGMLWSLDTREGGGATFAFLEPEWPPTKVRPAGRVAVFAAVLVVIVVAMMAPFFAEALRSARG